ncbi:heam-based aerotactic trancducer [Halovenus aranensis]|uniref:Heam-based aerotactic trancducer n=1 Tax=Halovenus aranensis TaxID=890420 RepID=A0A1G8VDB1_9EURY|nr:globin-coupled sensor protein [Halovenus aranensis]SDJ63939.1 heam-based aerotactic trancducer [Halovenus aranensis]
MKAPEEAFGKGQLNERVDAGELIADIGLDAEEIAWRKEFIGFTQEDAERLEAYQDAFAGQAEQVAADFYENITEHDETIEVMSRSEKGVDQLKRTQAAYLQTLVQGEYGVAYFRERARIGKLHDMLDMPMKQYLGQYGVYYDLILPIVCDRLKESLIEELHHRADDSRLGGEGVDTTDDEPEATVETVVQREVDEATEDLLAILRLINLDMQVATDTYIHSYSQNLTRELQRQQEVSNTVQDACEQLQTAADDIAVSSEEISDLARTQASAMEEASGEVGEMSATVQEIASTAQQVAATSQRAETLADEGREAATEAIDVMHRIDGSVQGVAADVDSLQERIDEIDAIVDIINDIADQTNMLALNASIEAARAGDAGEGFAVVADEVKSLAEQSQQHAGEVERLVDGIKEDAAETVASLEETTRQVEEGLEQVTTAMDTLQEIAENIQEVSEGVQEVSDATDDQAAGAEELASMVDELVDQSAQVADEIEDIAAANQEQATQVHEITKTVDRLADDSAQSDRR